jgi:ribonuclease HII
MLKLFKDDNDIEVGLDECARGVLLGRIYAAAVILPKKIDDEKIKLIKDSKKLSKKKRILMAKFIKEIALDYTIQWCDEKVVDEINILNANQKAFHKCLDTLKMRPNSILVDGNIFHNYRHEDEFVKHTCIIKGDNAYYSIAAASILAKVTHDEYILNLCIDHPELLKYDLDNNMGYGTKKHLDAIEKFGITPFHRKTFGCCKKFSGMKRKIKKKVYPRVSIEACMF